MCSFEKGGRGCKGRKHAPEHAAEGATRGEFTGTCLHFPAAVSANCVTGWQTILQMTLAMERKDEQMKIIQSNTEAYKFTICELEKRLAAPASTGTAVKGKGDAGKKHQVVGSDCVGGWKRLPAAPTTCEDVPPPPPQPAQQQPLVTAAKLRGGWKRLPAAPTTCVDVPPPPPQQPESCGGVGSASTTVKRKRQSLPAIPQGSLSTEQMLSTSNEEQATAKKHKPHARFCVLLLHTIAS